MEDTNKSLTKNRVQTGTEGTAGLTSLHTSLDTIEGSTGAVLIRKMENLNMNDENSAIAATQLSSAAIDRMRGISQAESLRQSKAQEETTSQISVGSIGPSLASLLPAKHLDLTPVMRNTTQLAAGQQISSQSHGNSPHYGVVSPEEDDLHGEHLALPSDLSDYDEMSSSRRGPGPVIPPIRAMRSSSSSAIGTGASYPLKAAFRRLSSQEQAVSAGSSSSGRPHPLSEPVSLDHKSHTFTSREEYKAHEQQQSLPEENTTRLQQYRPVRRDSEMNVGENGLLLPSEGLDSIFIQRRNDTEDSEKHHRMQHEDDILPSAIPMDDRQLSIPSLHLASRLQSDSTTSFSQYTDDEESQIVFINGGGVAHPLNANTSAFYDDESLSSRDNSSLYMGDNEFFQQNHSQLLGGTTTTTVIEPSSFFPPRIVHQDGNTEDHDFCIPDDMDEKYGATADDLSDEAVNGACRMSSKKRKQQKEWLHSIEGDEQCVAEAASSKFLNQTTNKTPISLQRQASTPTTSWTDKNRGL